MSEINEEYVEAFYIFKLSEKNLKKFEDYIYELDEENFIHNEFGFNDEHSGVVYEKYRDCEIHFLDQESDLSKIVFSIFDEVNTEFYEYDIEYKSEVQLIKYYPGGEYNWHCDYGLAPKKDSFRKLSISIQLSDPWEYTGGELELVDYGNRTHVLPKDRGIFVVFDSKVPHRVRPVTAGQRISLVGWANGPKLR
jgi:PKHD-type hydroxylase